VPRGKQTAYNFRTSFVRHLSNATLTQAAPAPRIVHRRILKKRRGTPESKKDRAKLLRIVLVLESQMPLRRQRLKKF
jgi:hypothetical protein